MSNNKIDKDHAAFACANHTHLQYGLTKREYFAGLAMQGLLSEGSTGSFEDIAKESVKFADELIKALNNEQQ